MDIVVYSKEDCIYCSLAKELLTLKNYQFTELKLNQHFTRSSIKATFPEAKTFPVIVIDKKWIGGYNELQILLKEEKMGSLIEVDFKGKALEDAKHVAETAEEVRIRTKELLDTEDYEEFLLAVMDEEYYATAEEEIRKLVDVYFDRISSMYYDEEPNRGV